MAKRKRLTPAQPGAFQPAPGADAGARGLSAAGALGPAAPAPIAQVAGEAAARAALSDLAAEMAAARSEGRLIEDLPLEVIDTRYLVRDRIEQDEEELRALMDSIRARGQQSAIEVVALPVPKNGKTHGLISGWRRVTALEQLHRVEKEPRFARARALVIAPESARDAYVAMVEENEIRVNLSLYERAHIVLRALHEEIFPTQRAALQGLFGATTRSKRSKIGSFIPLVEALDTSLRHPSRISEKLGLDLVRELARDHRFGPRLCTRLRIEAPLDGEGELRVLTQVLAETRAGKFDESAAPEPLSESLTEPVSGSETPRPRLRTPGTAALTERVSARPADGVDLRFTAAQNRIELTGAAVDARLYEALQDWLRARRE